MPKIYLQSPLPEEEEAQLAAEFPQYDFIHTCKDESDWYGVEVLYGQKLSEKELGFASRLKWIHCPDSDTTALCEEQIRNRGDILISLGGRQNTHQMAEFVIGAILSFAKQFFHWPKAPHDPQEFWHWPLKETMWTLKGKVLLQVGLQSVGTEIVRLAGLLGMKTWGVHLDQTFHPYCTKTFSPKHLHSLLPAADVVVLALPKKPWTKQLFGQDEFRLLKPDSVFIVVGSAEMIDENALAEVGKSGKLRGILVDAFKNPPPPKNSPIWGGRSTILTPSIADCPVTQDDPLVRLFRRNLRAYIPGKINEMKHLIMV